MLDLKEIRGNPKELEAKARTKDPTVSFDRILELDTAIRETKTRVEQLKASRNEASKQIGQMKRSGEDATAVIETVATHAEEIHRLDHELQQLDPELEDLLARVPNLPMDDVTVAEDPAENVVIKEVGSKRNFDFKPKNHLELNESLQLFDFARGAKVAGTGWPAYRGMGARLEWALLTYMIDTHISNGYTFWMPPLLTRPEVLFGSGQLPKFKGQFYEIHDDDYDLALVPTSEVALNGLHIDEIIDETALPLRYCAYSPCFRREAGAAGSGERGLIRVHQFNKVEMFCFATPEQSAQIFDEMILSAESILEGLGLHYRSMLLVTGDMSFAAAKTVDVECWLPGQDRYYEVSSVSNCTDYQSRRSKTRCRATGEKPRLLHTLNGSGLATSRLMVSLLENNQNADGSVTIPEVLHKYLGGVTTLEPIA